MHEDFAIRVEDLGKKYLLGQSRQSGSYTALRDVLAEAVTSPLRRWRSGPLARHDPKDGEEFWALRGIKLEVRPGEVVGIIGRNGAGKSTLLKILSRITEPTEGRIRIRGRVASLLEVGTGFHPELTGRENIYLNGAILGMKRIEIKARFDEIVSFAEVERFLDTPVKRYSSGMYVRLAFAVAAHLEPEILIVDEVLAVGDAEFQKKCIGKMEAASHGGKTVLFVSHNMDAILRLCGRAVLLKQGSVQFDGETRLAVTEYTAHHADQEVMADWSRSPRPLQSGVKARFTKGQMISSTGTPLPWSLRYGEAFGFEVFFQTCTTLFGLEFGLSIFTAMGLEITSNLSSQVVHLEQTDPGEHVVRVGFPGLRLLPGSYQVNLGLRSRSGFEDFLAKACTFEVLPSELSARHSTDKLRGVFVPEMEVAFEHFA